MEKKITIAIVGIFLIGIVSALVVPYLSGTITGTIVVPSNETNASVESMIFYLSLPNDLILNDNSSIEKGIANLTESLNNEFTFISGEIGIQNEGEFQINILVRTKTNGTNNLWTFNIIKINNEENITLCEAIQNTENGSNFTYKTLSCNSSNINLSAEDKIALNIKGIGEMAIDKSTIGDYPNIKILKQ